MTTTPSTTAPSPPQAQSLAELEDAFRAAAGRFASGVTVVALRGPSGLYGLTATSFVSLSLRPLLVSVSVNTGSALLDEVRAAGSFSVNVLGQDQQAVSKYFATRGRGFSQDAFPGIPSHTEVTGAPVLDGGLAWFDATVEAILPAGDHETLVGTVKAAGRREGEPLVYWSGGYRRLDPTDPGSPDDRIAPLSAALSEQLSASGLSPADLIDAQLALEPVAAELAAFRHDPETLAALRETMRRAHAAAGDPEAFTAEAVAFHTALGRASGNPAIRAALDTLVHARHRHYAAGTDEAATAHTNTAHQLIYDAIAQGDAEAARVAMTDHLAVVRTGLRQARPTTGD
nr:flavin reductase [Streptomyces sp. NBC_00886]